MQRLRCPKCKNQMNYESVGRITKKRKRCVYCGKSFKVSESTVHQKN